MWWIRRPQRCLFLLIGEIRASLWLWLIRMAKPKLGGLRLKLLFIFFKKWSLPPFSRRKILSYYCHTQKILYPNGFFFLPGCASRKSSRRETWTGAPPPPFSSKRHLDGTILAPSPEGRGEQRLKGDPRTGWVKLKGSQRGKQKPCCWRKRRNNWNAEERQIKIKYAELTKMPWKRRAPR